MSEQNDARTSRRRAVVTGAGSGIGAATARALAAAGFEVVCAARRADRVEALAKEIDGVAVPCDVTDQGSVAELARQAGTPLHVLVNSAGAAFAWKPVAEADPEAWRRMYDVNVLATLHVTQALLPALEASGDGVLVNVGCTAGRIAYESGAAHTPAEHGVAVMTETLRLELRGRPIRVTEIAPGVVRTEESSPTRFGGARERAEEEYAEVDAPLVAEDVADCVAWAVTRPSHVNVDLLVVNPRAQASQHNAHRAQAQDGRR
jgi:NADP-dependent 3-hydroxy acid dehydrogenase YdfG